MMNRIGSFTSIEQAANAVGRTKSTSGADNSSDISFEDIFNQKKSLEEVISETSGSLSPLKFSKHAGQRLEERDIQLTDEQLSRLEEGTQKAGSKGIKESLVLVDNMAFIVNTQNNTVVTAMDQDSNEDNIYTNIDGAVVI